MKKFAFAFAVTVILTVAAFADIRLPDTPKPATKTTNSIDSVMTIRLASEETEARLIIPKDKLKEVRAALEEMDDDPGANAAVSESNNFSRTQTIVSGVFMSLAIVFGGVWLTRRTETKTGKKIVAGAILFFIGSMTTLVYANAGPPSSLRVINGNLFDKKVFGGWNFASGKIKIELSNTARSVELIVPDKTGAAKTE